MPYISREDEAYNEGRDRQWHDDLLRATHAFIDLGFDDSRIMELLAQYFGLDSVLESKELINDAKKERQISRLRDLCHAQGIDGVDFLRYKTLHHLIEKLESNPKLLDLSPEKLKAAIEKD